MDLVCKLDHSTSNDIRPAFIRLIPAAACLELVCFCQYLSLPICICNSYTMSCPPVRGDNPRALARGLSYVQVDKHGITILYHLHQSRPRTS